MYVDGKMRPVETIPGGRIKENDGEVNSSMIYLIYCMICYILYIVTTFINATMYPYSAQQ
jgi:hypothetical protein